MIKSRFDDCWWADDLNWNEVAQLTRIELDARDDEFEAIAGGEDPVWN